MIDRDHALAITKQAEALNISRGSVYYLPRPVSAADLALMRRIDELPVMEIPFLNDAQAAVGIYHRHVVQHEASAGDLVALPTNLADYYTRCFDEARAIYDRRSGH